MAEESEEEETEYIQDCDLKLRSADKGKEAEKSFAAL